MANIQLALILVQLTGSLSGLRFASYYADHMVLQRGPEKAVVWGYASSIGEEVTVSVSGHGEVKTTVIKNPAGSEGIWKVKLPAIIEQGPFVLSVKSLEGEITLTDVMFGDIWVCSGQSNMDLSMEQVMNSTAEIARAVTFKTIRIFKVGMVESQTPLEDLKSIVTQWTEPTEDSIKSFSALCMLFAEYLHPYRNYPLGLVESVWSGTPIEPWSSPDAVAECPRTRRQVPEQTSVLWNSMIYPLLDMTIFGALWYQGESNTWYPDLYACQFPAMINDWREKFNAVSGETNKEFPFGFVQLAPDAKSTEIGPFPPLRWAQTAHIGYVPNEKMKNTFMAVAMDLPDYDSPFGTIHPRYKQDIASRLVLGARALAYNEADVSFKGPFPKAFSLDNIANTLIINYGEDNPINVLIDSGFEVCCSRESSTECTDTDEWVAAPITDQDTTSVTVSVSGCASKNPVGLRYEWRTSPCDLKKCAIYGSTTDLPAPPYITTQGF